MTTTERKRMRGAHQPTGQWIRTEKRLAIYLRDGFRCLYCREDLHSSAPAEIALDHLVAKSEGGSNNEANLVTTCRHCNCSRSDRSWSAFVQDRFGDGRIAETVIGRIRRQIGLDLRPFMKLAKSM